VRPSERGFLAFVVREGKARERVVELGLRTADGRVEVREARHGAPLPVVTHTHLHDGPKVVHVYDLHPLTPAAGVYHLRAAEVPADQSPATR